MRVGRNKGCSSRSWLRPLPFPRGNFRIRLVSKSLVTYIYMEYSDTSAKSTSFWADSTNVIDGKQLKNYDSAKVIP